MTIQNVRIFADTSSLEEISALAENPIIEGFTTNPSLMRAAGIVDYEKFAKDAIAILKEKNPNSCISLEVLSDDQLEMQEQAIKIHGWGKEQHFQVYVKIPILHYNGSHTTSLIEKLVIAGVSLNVTCVTNGDQYYRALNALLLGELFISEKKNELTENPHIISVFAGRIADAGIDPQVMIAGLLEDRPPITNIEVLWASSREIYNIIQADDIGCDIITLTPNLLKKLSGFGKHLRLVSLETVQQFYNDAQLSGFVL